MSVPCHKISSIRDQNDRDGFEAHLEEEKKRNQQLADRLREAGMKDDELMTLRHHIGEQEVCVHTIYTHGNKLISL